MPGGLPGPAVRGDVGCPAAARGPRRRRPPGPGVGRSSLEPGGVGGREDRGVPDVLHEPAVPAERRAQQHRHAGPQAGGHQAPAARHRPVSTRPRGGSHPAAPPAGGAGGEGGGFVPGALGPRLRPPRWEPPGSPREALSEVLGSLGLR